MLKKGLVIILALMFVLSIASTAMAATTVHSVDVPVDNWAYPAVQALVKVGIIDGYPDGTFHGDKAITRYEMAQIVNKAIANYDKATAQQKYLIDKLGTEFAMELNKIDVRVTNLENNASSIKFSAWERLSFQQNDALSGYTGGAGGTQHGNDYRDRNDFKLFLSGKINDDISFNGTVYNRIQTSDAGANFAKGTNDETREGTWSFSDAYITFNNILPTAVLTAGRMHVQVTNGMMFAGDYADGAQLTFGNANDLKWQVGYVDYTYMPGPDFLGSDQTANVYSPAKAFFAGVQGNIGKSTLSLGYWKSANNVPSNYELGTALPSAALPSILYKDTDIGFVMPVAPNLVWTSEYAKNNDSSVAKFADDDKMAWFTGIKYGNADKAIVGSYAVYAKYLKRGADAIDWRGSLTQFEPTFILSTDIQGATVGYDLTIRKNTILNLQYAKYKEYSTATNSGNVSYRPFYQASLALWF